MLKLNTEELEKTHKKINNRGNGLEPGSIQYKALQNVGNDYLPYGHLIL